MLMLSEEELDWLSGRIPDAERSAKGGRPPTDKREVIAGIFWVLDNGAKWKDLPSRFGPKSTVHRWFLKWVNTGVFESLMRAAGRCVEDTGRFRLYECFIDGTFSKAKSGGDGIGCTRVGKGVKIMILVDAQGLPVAACSTPANLAESHLIQQLFAFMIVQTTPARVIGDKAYDSDRLDELLAAQGVEMIAPNRLNRSQTQDGQPCDAANDAGGSNAPSPGSKTIADFAFAGKNLISPSKVSFTWPALSCSSRRFWDSY